MKPVHIRLFRSWNILKRILWGRALNMCLLDPLDDTLFFCNFYSFFPLSSLCPCCCSNFSLYLSGLCSGFSFYPICRCWWLKIHNFSQNFFILHGIGAVSSFDWCPLSSFQWFCSVIFNPLLFFSPLHFCVLVQAAISQPAFWLLFYHICCCWWWRKP